MRAHMAIRVTVKFLTLRVSPPAHPETTLEGLLGASWGHLGGDRSKKRGASIRAPPPEPLKSPPGPLLGRPWSALGRSWGRLGALLGPSWGPLGPSWSHLEASDGHRKRKGEKANTTGFL